MSKKKKETKNSRKEKAPVKAMVKAASLKKEHAPTPTQGKSKNNKHAEVEEPKKAGKGAKDEKAEKPEKGKRGKAAAEVGIEPLTRLSLIKMRHEALKSEIDKMLETDEDDEGNSGAGGGGGGGGEEE